MISSEALQKITLRYDAQFESMYLDGPAETRALCAVVGVLLHPWYVERVARAVLERRGFGANDFSFRYPVVELLDPGEALWEGVEVEAVHEVQYLAESAFESLIVRAMRAYLNQAPTTGRRPVELNTRSQVERLLQEIELRNIDSSAGDTGGRESQPVQPAGAHSPSMKNT